MSGFGSGFGSGPPSLPSFGTPAPGNPQQPQQQQFGGGGGFGTAQPSGGGFGVSGFGASPSPSTFGAGFGQQQPPQLTTNTSSFGGTNSFSSGNTAGGFGSTGGFGTTASAQPQPFGTSPASSSGFGSSTPFGGSAPQTSFGQQPTSSGVFLADRLLEIQVHSLEMVLASPHSHNRRLQVLSEPRRLNLLRRPFHLGRRPTLLRRHQLDDVPNEMADEAG